MDAKKKEKKNARRHVTSVLSSTLFLPPSLPAPQLFGLSLPAGKKKKKRGQKVRELQSVQKCFIAVMWREDGAGDGAAQKRERL